MTRSSERLVLDALPAAVYAVDLEGNVTFANRRWDGSGDAPAAGTTIWDELADLASRPQLEQAMATLRGGRTDTVTWELSSGAAEAARILLLQASAIHDGRAVAGFVLTIADVTASHHAREALLDAGIALARTISVDRVFHEVAHQLRQVMPCDAIAIALAEGGEELQLAHHVGFEQDAAALEAELRPVWQSCIRGARPASRPTSRGLEITAPLVGAEGVVGALTVVSDQGDAVQRDPEAEHVVATVAAEAAVAIERARLVRRVEQRRRIEAIGEVAAGVAAELRNPLFGISSAAQLLRFRVREDPVVERNVGRILREVERLNGLVTSLLEYGRPEPPKLRAADPDALWDELLASQRGLLESKALGVTRTRPRRHASCRLDPDQIGHVFLAALSNAVEAAPEGTDLALTSEVLPNGAWRCRLQNGGAPVPADVLPRVFELFVSTKEGGAGIGLPLCQRIVEAHGGTITLDSSAIAGTMLTVTLPAATPVPARTPTSNAAQQEMELA